MLNLNMLRVFHAVAKNKSVVKAATALFISQPAVSNALKRLQRDSGIRLFHKTGRTLTLTEHGAALYILTVRLFDVEKEIESLFGHVSSKARHTIHVGLVTIYERFGIADIMRYFSEVDSSLSVSIHSGNSRSIVEMLLDHSIDLAISGDVVVNDSLRQNFYKRHEVLMVAPRGHALYGNPTFTGEDLQGKRVVLKEAGSSARKTMDVFLDKFAVNPIIVMELSNIDAILNLAKSELCLAFLPDMSINETHISEGLFSVARSEEHDLSFSTYIISHAPETYAETTRKIIDRFCEVIESDQRQPDFFTDQQTMLVN